MLQEDGYVIDGLNEKAYILGELICCKGDVATKRFLTQYNSEI